MILLIHGPDELLRSEQLAILRASLGPAELADLSMTRLDGRRTTVAEIRHHCDALPFLTPRRLVVVDELLAHRLRRRPAGRTDQEPEEDPEDSLQEQHTAASDAPDDLVDYLPILPGTTDLALVETSTISNRSPIGKDPAYKLIAKLARQGQAEIIGCQAPSARELPSWIARRVQEKGAQIEGAAAYDLATFVGPNLRLLDSELDKLAAYRAGAGSIRRQDVRLLVPYAQEANIFDMVDAIGRQDAASALRLLRELERDGAAPLYLLSMIVRQFRILIQVSEQMGQGKDKDTIAKAIDLHPYPTQKAMQQSRNWRLHELEAAYDRLLDTDAAIKTGRMGDELALDLLVVELATQRTEG